MGEGDLRLRLRSESNVFQGLVLLRKGTDWRSLVRQWHRAVASRPVLHCVAMARWNPVVFRKGHVKPRAEPQRQGEEWNGKGYVMTCLDP